MAWLNLFVSGILEIFWALGLKYSNGFTVLLPSLVTIVLIILSFFFFSKAMKSIPIGTAYAIFTGIGSLGTVIIGMLFLNEPKSITKMFFVSLLLIGIVGLKLTSSQESEKIKEQSN